MLFGNLSGDSQKVLAIAAEESRTLRHLFLGTEHLFVGLCSVQNETVIEIFEEFSIAPFILREIRARVGMGDGGVAWGEEMILTPRAQNISEIVNDIAKTYQVAQIEPVHLLLALIKAGDGVAVRVLKDKGINMERMQSAVQDRVEEIVQKSLLPPSAAKTPFLNKVGKDLTLLARQSKIGPVIGRKAEIRKIAQILAQKGKNSPILVGEAGVGKTAVVEGLALRLLREDIPEELKGLRIIEVNLPALVAGTKYRGDFEERILRMIDEARSNPDIVLFIDEVHNIMGAGSASGSLDASSILKPALARGEVRCIGATTIAEYRQHIEKDAAMGRRFLPVYIEEPTREETGQIIQGLKDTYERHHKIKLTPGAIDAAVNLSIRYIHDRKLPDKAIDLIDQALARRRLASLSYAESHEEVAAQERQPECDAIAKAQITAEDVARVVAEWTGIPANELTADEMEKLFRMEEALAKRVIGQEEAVTAVSEVIRTARAGLKDARKPSGVFLFVGATGVGKTELARALAEYLFGDERRLIRIDMSEYMEKHAVARLIGSPPGYIGHDEEGQLTGPVRTNPYSVILFDEVEKADLAVMDIFLQIFDDGHLTDAHGRRVSFSETVIILTSNLGKVAQTSARSMGFARAGHTVKSAEVDKESYRERIMEEVEQWFRPELLNRIQRIVFFYPLDEEAVRKIIDKFLDELRFRLRERNIDIELTDAAYKHLMKEGYDPDYGAREMERAIERLMVQPLGRALLEGRFAQGATVLVDVRGEKLILEDAERTLETDTNDGKLPAKPEPK